MSWNLRGFYELTDVLIVLDEVLCRKVSNLVKQLKFKRPILDRRQKVILNRYLGNTRYKASNKLIDIYLFSQHGLKNPRISFNLLVSSFPWVVLPKIIDGSVICHERCHCQYPLLSLHKLVLHSFLYLLYQRWCHLFRLLSHIIKPRCQERPSSSLLR